MDDISPISLRLGTVAEDGRHLSHRPSPGQNPRCSWVSLAIKEQIKSQLFHHYLHGTLRTQDAAILDPAALRWWEIEALEVPQDNSLAWPSRLSRPSHNIPACGGCGGE